MRSPRLAALLACLSLTSGCSAAGGWYPGRVETATGLGSHPSAAETETLNRIANRWQPPLPPVFIETGDVWPGPPPVVLTLVDLRRERGAAAQNAGPPRRHRGGYGMCGAPSVSAKVAPGVALGIC